MILFRPVLGQTSGLAHLKRSVNIARHLEKKHPIGFVVKGSKLSGRFFSDLENFTMVEIPENIDLLDEISLYPKSLNAVVADIADNKNLKNQHVTNLYFKELTKLNCAVVALDGVFSDSLFNDDICEVDVVIRPYVHADMDVRRWGKINLAGKDYVILNDCFQNNMPRFEWSNKSKSMAITVSFGGSDPTLLTEYFCQNIFISDLFSKYRFDVVVGPLFGDKRRLSLARSTFDRDNISILTEVDCLKKILSDACMAITSSGAATRYEAAFCGVPVAFVAFDTKHVGIAQNYEMIGCAKYLGDQRSLDVSNVIMNLSSLLNDEKELTKMGKAGQTLIDGKGIGRIVSVLDLLLGGRV